MTDSERTHEAKGRVAQWRGTPSRLAVVVARAYEIGVEAVAHRNGGDLTTSVDVHYPDGRETFPTAEGFMAGASDLPVQRIESITAMVWSVQHGMTIELTADNRDGVKVRVGARDEVLAYGARDVLDGLLEQNRAPRVTGFGRRRLRFLPSVTGIAVLGFLSWLFLASDVSDAAVPLVLAGLGVLLGAVTAATADPKPIFSPPLELLAHDEPTRPVEPQPAGLRAVVAWLNANPFIGMCISLLALAATIVIAVATN